MKNVTLIIILLLTAYTYTKTEHNNNVDSTLSSAAGDDFYTPQSDLKGIKTYTSNIRGLPNVLIIGDSISIGYTNSVRKELQNVVNVYRIPVNGGNTIKGLNSIDEWLGNKSWDLIHFNWGLHDLCYRHPESKAVGRKDKVNGIQDVPIDEYKKNLEQLVIKLKQTNAALIWATTTFIPQGELGRFMGDELKYNTVANSIMQKHKIPINDLHTLSQKNQTLLIEPDNVHFTEKGSKILGKQVAEYIESHL